MVMKTFKSRHFEVTLRKPSNRTSVLILRSCAPSIIIKEYLSMSKSRACLLYDYAYCFLTSNIHFSVFASFPCFLQNICKTHVFSSLHSSQLSRIQSSTFAPHPLELLPLPLLLYVIPHSNNSHASYLVPHFYGKTFQ